LLLSDDNAKNMMVYNVKYCKNIITFWR